MVVEFFDYWCGYCKCFVSWVVELLEKYNNQVCVVFKEYLILLVESEKVVFVVLVVGKQGKYIEMYLVLMEFDNGIGFGLEIIDVVVELVGVDVIKMWVDMKLVDVQKIVVEFKGFVCVFG